MGRTGLQSVHVGSAGNRWDDLLLHTIQLAHARMDTLKNYPQPEPHTPWDQWRNQP